MFKLRIDEIVKDLPNVFGISHNMDIVGSDKNGHDHYAMLW